MNHIRTLFALAILFSTLSNVIAAVSEEIKIIVISRQRLIIYFQDKPLGAHTCSADRIPEDDLFSFDTSKAGK